MMQSNVDWRGVRRFGLGFASALALSTSAAAYANSIDDAVRETADGRLRFYFAAREGVWGDGHSITIHSHFNRYRDDDWEFEPGPVRVVLTVRDAEVTRVKHSVGGRWRSLPRNTTDLGDIDPADAVDFLMRLVEKAPASVAEDAIAAAALADEVELWPDLLDIARQRDRSHQVRKTAVFWLGQAVADAILGNLRDLAMDEDDDLEVREAAVFAISQRPEDESVPTLIRIARSEAHPKVRRSALFWLSQTDDPRVIEFFEDILTDR